MLAIEYTTQFKRDLKRARRRNLKIDKLKTIMQKIAAQEILDIKFSDHALIGNWHNHRELHIEAD